MVGEKGMLSHLTNAELIHKNKYCKIRAKDIITELRELVSLSNQLKAEFKIRLIDLEIELELAESDRFNSEDPFFDALLSLH